VNQLSKPDDFSQHPPPIPRVSDRQPRGVIHETAQKSRVASINLPSPDFLQNIRRQEREKFMHCGLSFRIIGVR
jgi:hypothetical protein